MTEKSDVTGLVRERYASAPLQLTGVSDTASASCCVPTYLGNGSILWRKLGTSRGTHPASLGCGNPTAVADLRAGETVLDLGSGGGIDVLLSARRVGLTGFAYGLDMTDEVLTLARANASKVGATNVVVGAP